MVGDLTLHLFNLLPCSLTLIGALAAKLANLPCAKSAVHLNLLSCVEQFMKDIQRLLKG